MREVLCGIVTFNPNIERLEKNLLSICSQVDRILIIDNSSDNFDSVKELSKKIENCKIVHNVKNYGIAFALNQIGLYSKSNCFKYILNLDQDSICCNRLVYELKKNIECDNNLGLVCPRIITNKDSTCNEESCYLNTAITSGSFYKTSVFEKLFGYRNYLFIDEVDHEFCYRMRNQKLLIKQINSVYIEHIIGDPKKVKILFYEFNPSNHSAFRRYFITRNSLIVNKIFPNEKKPIRNRKLTIFKTFISVCLVEKDKINKIKAMCKGINDAKKRKKTYKEYSKEREECLKNVKTICDEMENFYE